MKTRNILWIVAVASLAFTSCNKKNQEKYGFTADAG